MISIETLAPQLDTSVPGTTYRRGSLRIWMPVSVVLVLLVAYLRLGVYPDRFVPLSSILVLLLSLWHRDLRLHWTIAGSFIAMIIYKSAFLVSDAAAPGNQEWLFGLMQLTNVSVAACVIHAAIVLSVRLEATVTALEQTNAELEASNEELAAREEEITQQNEELQSQTEELEQQTEELNSQTEELQTLNEQLAQRERTLDELLETTATGATDATTLRALGDMVQRLLGKRAAGAAVLEPENGEMVVQPLFGVATIRSRLQRDRTLAELGLVRDRAAALADTELRPDLDTPELAGGDRVRSLATAPFKTGTAARGALEVYGTEPGKWTDEELRIVQWLARQCGLMRATLRLQHERDALLDAERAARADAERANHAKDEFVATLSHELRTPLNAVLGWASVLKRGDLSNIGQVREGLEVIERNARQQGQLISDLLDISRITVGKLHLEVQNVDLQRVIEGALSAVRQTAESKGVRLEHKVADGHPIYGDPMRLQQVVWNLLSNSIKFTPKGGSVQVALSRLDAFVQITVTDDGEGIDPELVGHLFERYRQADSSSTRRHGGLGLGLAIVRHLVELHGGTVHAQSGGRGQGATFTVLLPIRPAVAGDLARERGDVSPSAGDSGMPELTGVKILLVDDEQDARDLIVHILRDRGADVQVALSGAEALNLLARARPDVLVSDIGMPGMDGYALIREIRGRASAGEPPLPAIALTAFARSEDRTRALLAGFQAHIAKPVNSTELVATIARLRYAATAARD
jgi:signal transduction histidine kinase/ActR/RegA family two-component response regulator